MKMKTINLAQRILKMPKSIKHFKNYLKEIIKGGSKTTYGKNELILFIEELYAVFLEMNMEKGNE